MRYHEIMNRITVTDEMQKRILGNIVHEDFKVEKNVTKMQSLRKYVAIAACFMLAVFGTITIPGILHISEPQEDILTGPNIVEVSSASELTKTIGFTMNDIETLKSNADEVLYIAYDGVGEITYSIGETSISFRKSIGKEDNSGDYNEYENEKQFMIKDSQITLHGNEEVYHNAIWSDDRYSYSIYCFDGMTEQEMEKLITEIINISDHD